MFSSSAPVVGPRARRRTTDAARASVISGIALISVIPAIWIGAVAVDPGETVRILVHHAGLGGLFDITADWSASTDAIVWRTRAPRVALAAIVGAVLAVCGLVLQAIVRNPLADPYLLGVSSGASTGAALAIVVFSGTAVAWLTLPAMAFAGSLVATFAVVAFTGWRSIIPMRLVLAGMAVGYAFSSLTSLLIFASDSPEATRGVMFWLLGSVSSAQWDAVGIVVFVALALAVLCFAIAPSLDAIAAGELTAVAVGVEPARLRMLMLVAVSLAVGAVVAVSGGIGFVGLVIPHVVRGICGSRHRSLVPVSMAVGAAFLVWSDVIARTVFSPQELPIGIVTGLVGAPFLLVLLRRHRASS